MMREKRHITMKSHDITSEGLEWSRAVWKNLWSRKIKKSLEME